MNEREEYYYRNERENYYLERLRRERDMYKQYMETAHFVPQLSDEEKLEKMDIKVIESFLRKKKLQNLK